MKTLIKSRNKMNIILLDKYLFYFRIFYIITMLFLSKVLTD